MKKKSFASELKAKIKTFDYTDVFDVDAFKDIIAKHKINRRSVSAYISQMVQKKILVKVTTIKGPTGQKRSLLRRNNEDNADLIPADEKIQHMEAAAVALGHALDVMTQHRKELTTV